MQSTNTVDKHGQHPLSLSLLPLVLEHDGKAAQLLAQVLKIGLQVGAHISKATAPAGGAHLEGAGGWGGEALALFHVPHCVGQRIKQQTLVDSLYG